MEGTNTFAACSRAEVVALIALPGSLFALVTSMEKDFRPYLVPPEDTCRPPGSILARQSSVSWESISAPPTVRSLGIEQLGGSTSSKVSGCTTRTKCLGRRVLRSFCCDAWASSVQRTVCVRQLSCTPPPRSAGDPAPRSAYGTSKGVPVGLSGGRCRLDTAYLCHSARFPPPLLSVCMTSTEHPPQ